MTCTNGYILTTDNRRCVVSNATTLPNCGVATTEVTPTCAQCINGSFTLTTLGACQQGGIANCLAHNYSALDADYNVSREASRCIVCNPGYYAASNGTRCDESAVTNCVRSGSDANRCVDCASGYTKIGNSGVNNAAGTPLADVCFPNPTVGNCATFDLDTDNLNCLSCTNPATQAITATVAPAPSTCLSFSTVSQCSAFAVTTLALSDFTCTACNPEFFLRANKCVQRTNIPRCAVRKPTLDECQTCDDTSYLSSDAKSCILKPSGIFGCSTYSNATTCTACKPGQYLANNACVGVTTVISGCATYSSATVCSSCNPGNALSNNTCVAATALNCTTYNSPSACATCPAGHVLSTSNSVTSCTPLAKTGCATIDANPPNNCLTCNTGYYLINGTCNSATTIGRCAVYATATTCSRCELGYALSIDKACLLYTSPSPRDS